MLEYYTLNTNVNRIKFGFLLILSFLSFSFFAQNIKVIPVGDVFSPNFEDVESLEYGIILYDQYANFQKKPNIRKGTNSNPINGKKEDLSSNNLLLHKGYYQDGKLRGYTNYFQNESIEREYKYKADGTGDLFIYYLNGYTKSVQRYYNFEAYHWEDYYENGQLAYMETKGKKNGIPELIQENNYNGKTITQIEISDNKNKKYIQTMNWPNGKISEQGELFYNEDLEDFRKDGRWVTYNQNEQVTSEIIYQKGSLKEVLSDTRPDSEKTYLITNTEQETMDADESSESPKVNMPESIARFDRNNDKEITNKEIDLAVNDFFEDDAITRDQINKLVNYFFEQD
jgi:antitoxin component YwqK of YwqJK toxin-antitoxin module